MSIEVMHYVMHYAMHYVMHYATHYAMHYLLCTPAPHKAAIGPPRRPSGSSDGSRTSVVLLWYFGRGLHGLLIATGALGSVDVHASSPRSYNLVWMTDEICTDLHPICTRSAPVCTGLHRRYPLG